VLRAAGVLQQGGAAGKLQKMMQQELACCGQHVGWNGWAGRRWQEATTQGMAGLGWEVAKCN